MNETERVEWEEEDLREAVCVAKPRKPVRDCELLAQLRDAEREYAGTWRL